MIGRRVAVVLAVAFAFFVGRATSSCAPAHSPSTRAVVAQWDGGAVYEDQLENWLAATRMPRTDDAVRDFVTTRVLASVAREERLDETPAVSAVCDQALIDALRSRQPAVATPTDEEVKAAWERDTQRYTQGETLKLGMIQLAPDAGAERVLADLQTRMQSDFYAFSDLAQRLSVDPQQRLTGGDLPAMSLEDVERLVGERAAQQLATLNDGDLFPSIITTPRGPAIMRVIEHHQASTTPLERVSAAVRKRLQAEKADDAWKAYVLQLLQSRALTPSLTSAAPAPSSR